MWYVRVRWNAKFVILLLIAVQHNGKTSFMYHCWSVFSQANFDDLHAIVMDAAKDNGLHAIIMDAAKVATDEGAGDMPQQTKQILVNL